MDYKTGLLVFITLQIGGFAFPMPEHDMSIFFNHADANARVVGGTQAVAGSHPHMVALSHGAIVRNFLCGASLITQRTVLTAAHCIDSAYGENGLIDSFRVSVGSTQWNTGTEYTIDRNVTHPDYNYWTIKHDIGVLITSTNVVLNNLVQTVPITYDFILGGVDVILAGWGGIRTGGPLSRDLLELRTSTLDGADCMIHATRSAVLLNMWFSPPVDHRFEVCTFHSTGFGACNGDSGSPLRRASDGHQFGIASWAFPCARGGPDVYVRISSYQIWLNSVVV